MDVRRECRSVGSTHSKPGRDPRRNSLPTGGGGLHLGLHLPHHSLDEEMSGRVKHVALPLLGSRAEAVVSSGSFSSIFLPR